MIFFESWRTEKVEGLHQAKRGLNRLNCGLTHERMISGVLSKTGYVLTLIMSQLYYSDRNDFGVCQGTKVLTQWLVLIRFNSVIVSEGWGRHPICLWAVSWCLAFCQETATLVDQSQTFHRVSCQGFEQPPFLPIAAQRRGSHSSPTVQESSRLVSFEPKLLSEATSLCEQSLGDASVALSDKEWRSWKVYSLTFYDMSLGTEVCFLPMLPPHQCNTITYINNHTNIHKINIYILYIFVIFQTWDDYPKWRMLGIRGTTISETWVPRGQTKPSRWKMATQYPENLVGVANDRPVWVSFPTTDVVFSQCHNGW